MTQPPQPPAVGPPLDAGSGPVAPPARSGLPSAESWFETTPPVACAPRDRAAVAALVLSLPGLVPIAAVVAVIALRRIRRSGARGRGLALVALAVCACWTIALGLAAALGVYGENKAGIGRSVEISEVQPGQCFDADLEADTLRRVTIAYCAGPHAGEAYAKVRAALAGLSAEAKETAATRQCAAAFQEFVGRSYEASALDMYYVVLEDRALADGNVLCMVGKPGEELTGSMRGSRR